MHSWFHPLLGKTRRASQHLTKNENAAQCVFSKLIPGGGIGDCRICRYNWSREWQLWGLSVIPTSTSPWWQRGWGGQTDDGILWRLLARRPDYHEKKMTWQGVMTTTVMMMMSWSLSSVGGRGSMAAPYLWSKDHCIESVAMVNEQPRIIFELPIEMDPNGDNTPSGDGQLGRNTGISHTALCRWWC